MKYSISLCGCDDSTTTVMDLTEKEYELLKRVAKDLNRRSDYGCMPTMEINGIMKNKLNKQNALIEQEEQNEQTN